MKTQKKYWLIICVALSVTLAALIMVGLLFWLHLSLEAQQYVSALVVDYFGYFFSAGFVLFLAFGFAADWIFRAYVKPINRMAEEIDLINRVNPDLRVTIRGSHDVRQLGKIMNQSAELLASPLKNQDHKQGITQSETEKAILVSFLSNMPQAIMVCNLDGRIVFYNRKVKELLLPAERKAGDSSDIHRQWMGLGRSAYNFIDKTLILESLDRMAGLLTEERPSASERFLLMSDHDTVMPAELLPVLDSQRHITGYIIYIEDLAAKMKREKEDAKHWQLWQHQLTQSISIIKTAAELLVDEPLQSKLEHQQMVQILVEQSDLAARLWTEKKITDKWSETSFWPLTSITVEQWSRHLLNQLISILDLEFDFKPKSQQAMISIDIHHLTKCVVSLLENLQRQFHIATAQAVIYVKESWLYVDVIWEGQGIEDDALKQWKLEPHSAINHEPAMNPEKILAWHGAKLWPYRKPDRPESSGLRLLIPTITDSEPQESNGRVTILPEPRPEFYDFDLFQQAGHSPGLGEQHLDDLTYTVFDTETTGLDPSGGDEIISIAAIRIVNGRLLKEDQFSQLVDPKRHLPWASIKYHGIRPEMLIDKPSIEQVLPKFQRFVQDTVMVGHNVAFDMRMLQMKEELTGVTFINTVLDTMLLSSIVHPAQENHNLSGVAERVGVEIRGRHTALGDATATAEIFLKMIPLLALKGIHTIGQAIDASKDSYYARLKY